MSWDRLLCELRAGSARREEDDEAEVETSELPAAELAEAGARPQAGDSGPDRPRAVSEAEDKDLDEKDAESDLEAEESDQEGI